MKILVLSDSHNDSIALQTAIRAVPDAQAVFYLGDGLEDWHIVEPGLFRLRTAAVRGNCDSFLQREPLYSIVTVEGRRVYLTHGHKEGVKAGLDRLLQRAAQENCELALFGHTHRPVTGCENGIWYMNPGSARHNSCGVVDIRENGILCSCRKIL